MRIESSSWSQLEKRFEPIYSFSPIQNLTYSYRTSRIRLDQFINTARDAYTGDNSRYTFANYFSLHWCMMLGED